MHVCNGFCKLYQQQPLDGMLVCLHAHSDVWIGISEQTKEVGRALVLSPSTYKGAQVCRTWCHAWIALISNCEHTPLSILEPIAVT
jgi:hypothetical protein